MRVLILGAGAVGGYIGARLMAAGADVLYLARGRRLQSLCQSGLVVAGPTGIVTYPVKVTDVPDPAFFPQVVIVACKAPALPGALETIAPSIGPKTRVLPLLNGVAHLGLLKDRFPNATPLGGLVHGAFDLRADGVAELQSPFCSAAVGALSCNSDPVAQELAQLLTAGGMNTRLSSNILQDMWNKFVFLTTLAGMTCLMRADVGTIMASRYGERLTNCLLSECISVAAMEGFPPDDASMESYTSPLFERGSEFTSSMLRDIRACRGTEADHIVGDMLRRAERGGMDTPLLTMAYTHLQCFELLMPSA